MGVYVYPNGLSREPCMLIDCVRLLVLAYVCNSYVQPVLAICVRDCVQPIW